MIDSKPLERKRLRITGQVQGVGFRPFVYRLASQLALTGWVINDGRGVFIEIQGQAPDVGEFLRRLVADWPPWAGIVRKEEQSCPPIPGESAFEIRASQGGELSDAQ